MSPAFIYGPVENKRRIQRQATHMSGEGACSVRMRLTGTICVLCRAPLPTPHIPGEQLCARRAVQKKPSHRVYMSIQTQNGWKCQFLEEDLKSPIPVRLNLIREDKLFETAERGGYQLILEGRQAMQRAIDTGRGGIWLDLTEEQYRKLKGVR
jgi:hypothetical protein